MMTPEMYLTVMGMGCVLAFILSLVLNRDAVRQEVAATIKQDISIQQMRDAEERVAIFLRGKGIAPGTDILKIGETLNIYEGVSSPCVQGYAHLSLPNKDGLMSVTYRKGLKQPERKFAFAHECGHVINKDSLPIDRPTGKHKSSVEQEADYVAAALLMPIDDVFEFLEQNNYHKASRQSRVRLINKLSRKYGMSKDVVLRRIREVCLVKDEGHLSVS